MSDKPKFYIVEKDGPVVIWKLNNPPVNLWTVETGIEFNDLLDRFYADDDLRVGIFTSALDDVFIAHFDVTALLEEARELRAASPDKPPESRWLRARPRKLGPAGSKPIICAINATCTGGGAGIACACDFRYMSRKAVIGWREVSVGLGGGGSPLVDLIGYANALEMTLLGKLIGADEAQRIGLVHHACDPEELMPVVLECARTIASYPVLSVTHLRRGIYEAVERRLDRDTLARLQAERARERLRSDETFRLLTELVESQKKLRE